jgi:hypothetical protein
LEGSGEVLYVVRDMLLKIIVEKKLIWCGKIVVELE